MPEFQISRESLEARDAVSDCDSIAQRIESYRHLYPTDNPKLIVASESDAAPVECCIPEVTLEELSADCLRSARRFNCAQYVFTGGSRHFGRGHRSRFRCLRKI